MRIRWCTLALATPALAVTLPWLWVRAASLGRVTGPEDVPPTTWAVVLGAGVQPDGRPQNALRYRLERTLDLYRSGRCARILVSGGTVDGRDEPAAMARFLRDRGVPEEAVTEDRLGRNTFNSAQRTRHVFGIEDALVVTQGFHVHRAVALFRAAGVDARGVADREGRLERRTWLVGHLREVPANGKALADVLTRRRFLAPELDLSSSKEAP